VYNFTEQWKLLACLLLYCQYGYEKKIDNGIDFLRDREKKIVSIFHLPNCEKVGLNWGPKMAWPKIYT